MKRTLLIVLLLSCLFSCKKQPADRGYIVEVGDIAPDFTAKLVDGTTFSLSAQRGKVVMLQFTASWCGVCRKEMPFIEHEIYQIYKDKDFVIIGIDRDEPLETMQKFAKETEITYPLAFDPNADIFALYAHKEAGVTRNVIISREGRICYLTRLFDKKEFEAMKEVIAKKLER